MKRARDAETIVIRVRDREFTCSRTVLATSPPGILRDMLLEGLFDETGVDLDRDAVAFEAVMSAVRREDVLVPYNTTRAAVLREMTYFFDEMPHVWTNEAYETVYNPLVRESIATVRRLILDKVATEIAACGHTYKANERVEMSTAPVFAHTSGPWSLTRVKITLNLDDVTQMVLPSNHADDIGFPMVRLSRELLDVSRSSAVRAVEFHFKCAFVTLDGKIVSLLDHEHGQFMRDLNALVTERRATVAECPGCEKCSVRACPAYDSRHFKGARCPSCGARH